MSDELNFSCDSSNFISTLEMSPIQSTIWKTKVNLMRMEHKRFSFQATEEMNRRVSFEIEQTAPTIDLNDISKKRQFAPEYSQTAYNTMLCEEYAVGDYLNTATEKYLQIDG